MKKYYLIVIATALLLGGAMDNAYAQSTRTPAPDKDSLNKLIAAVQQMPDSLKAHEAYLAAAGLNAASEAQYKKWIAQFPNNATVLFAIGEAFADQESPKARPYLLKAVALQPKMADAWGKLWIDAERWGDFKGGQQYLEKAKNADTNNVQYAFYYANSFRDTDTARFRTLSLEVASRFPNNTRGAQSLYWLANYTIDTLEKIKIYEQLKNSYSPLTDSWSAAGTNDYYELLLKRDPAKAVSLATSIAQMKTDGAPNKWDDKVILAQKLQRTQSLPGDSALAVLSTIKVSRYSPIKDQLILLKAKANASLGRIDIAYDSLITAFFKSPSLELHNGIVQYGAQLGKNKEQVIAELYQRLVAQAQPATPFTLKRYLTPGNASLSDFKGKVVLLTYWFPGCGPCRGEFPHFQHVIDQYKDKAVAYVGINIESEQNDYVRSFMKQSGYTFTPLEEIKDRVKGNLNNGGAAPVNFLIDQQGRVVFSNFRINKDNEPLLNAMIDLLLTHPA
ncbi:Thiol-disulfide isomerase or thioredoxin [Chitinophaga costaii]|uniref:Thiol-disulfide isomerase or thioredoxin n=1 Tax=Chitinophaga costaii TaxID=1335309 RepID=A0A1C4EYB9_9BACT|nr:TlpA disulfide reductase family protein [Chitinophaga costaii]PUZ21557.1 hypothetical protein DCM91_16090 [Chitinophaga costaii]SCC48552.1 Thiol-disulfide isomerase or thioredoxin [Chitinophaga costaii]